MSDTRTNYAIIGGSTSISIRAELFETGGDPKTDALAADLTLQYLRPGGTLQTVSLSDLSAVDDAFSAGGVIHITNGAYRIDVPDAAFAAITGGGMVFFSLSCSGCDPRNFEIAVVSQNASTVHALASQVKTKTDLILASGITIESPLAADGTTLTEIVGDSWEIAVSGLGNLTGRSKLWFALKERAGDSDANALLLIEETAGLTIVNKASHATGSDGALIVDDEAAGDVRIRLSKAVSPLLPLLDGGAWGIKSLIGTTADTHRKGVANLIEGPVDAVA